MPHCPNCGNSVQEEHHYCGQCGYQLASYLDEDEEGVPPSGTAAGGEGFLSGRSIQYISHLLDNGEIDEDDPGYATLRRDMASALHDFAYIAQCDQINLLLILGEESSGRHVLSRDPGTLNDSEFREWMMWMGFMRIPRIYDRSIGTDFSDNLDESIDELIEKIQEIQEETEKV